MAPLENEEHLSGDERRALYEIACDSIKNVTDRASALYALLLDKDPKVSNFIMKELEHSHPEDEWCHYLVHYIEEIEFTDSVQRARLQQLLFTIANHIAQSTADEKPNVILTFCSAVRQLSLSIPTTEVHRLIDFLQSQTIEIRQATIQAIERIYDPHAFPHVHQVDKYIRDAVLHELKRSMELDLDHPRNMAYCSAVFTAAIVVNEETLPKHATSIRETWLSCAEHIGILLKELEEDWDTMTPPVTVEYPARHTLKRCRSVLPG